jgi:hypothetical protein
MGLKPGTGVFGEGDVIGGNRHRSLRLSSVAYNASAGGGVTKITLIRAPGV